MIIEGFDLFTEHARQALLYCLCEYSLMRWLRVPVAKMPESAFAVDVVQSVRTGPVESTGRGVAVIGVTSRVVSTFGTSWSNRKT